MNIIEWIHDHKWAITPGALDAMVQVVTSNESITKEIVAKSMHGQTWERYLDGSGNISDFWALEAVNYPLLEGTRRVSLAGRVAILPVVGPIFPRANLMTLSGGASVQSLAYDFTTARDSNEVSAIIMEYDTPGGEITGIDDFAKLIYDTRKKKPVVSFIYGMGASAGFWLASAGKEIIIGNTGEAGSIGVVALYSSNKRDREKRGYDDYEIVSSQSPNKRPDPSTDKGRLAIQTTVDQLASVFIGSVAKYRGVSESDVLENYGQGGMFVGQAAVDAGLADRTGTLESVIAELNESTKTTFFLGGPMTLQELKTNHPAVYEEAVAVGRKEAEAAAEGKIATAKQAGEKEGAEKERTRIQGIELIAVPGAQKIINENKFKPEATKESVSALILESQKAERERMKNNHEKDGDLLAGQSGGLGNETPPDTNAEEAAMVAAMKKGFDGYAK